MAHNLQQTWHLVDTNHQLNLYLHQLVEAILIVMQQLLKVKVQRLRANKQQTATQCEELIVMAPGIKVLQR